MRKLIAMLFVATVCMTGCVMSNITVPSQENVYNIDKPKKELYVLANEWMVRKFNNAESVIQFQDKDAGKIVGKYVLSNVSNNQVSQVVYAVIDISIKDGSIKIDIEPQGEWVYDPSEMTIYKYSSDDAQKDIKDLSNDLRDYLKNHSSEW